MMSGDKGARKGEVLANSRPGRRQCPLRPCSQETGPSAVVQTDNPRQAQQAEESTVRDTTRSARVMHEPALLDEKWLPFFIINVQHGRCGITILGVRNGLRAPKIS